eukprot:COSAG01_NODE_9816_length_2333_cov_19.949013_2_plen_56_part_00
MLCLSHGTEALEHGLESLGHVSALACDHLEGYATHPERGILLPDVQLELLQDRRD